MKLYNIPRGSYIRISKIQDAELSNNPTTKGKSKDILTPISSLDVKPDELIYFSHIDGMYSLCYKVDETTLVHGDMCHIAAWTEVEIIDPIIDIPFERLREIIGRSGYGKDGKGEFRESTLANMSDDWVIASIKYVPDAHIHRGYYIQEMKYRKDNNISIKDSGI